MKENNIKQFKEPEFENIPQNNNPQNNTDTLTKEQQGLLQEFREKVNSETVKESLRQSKNKPKKYK